MQPGPGRRRWALFPDSRGPGQEVAPSICPSRVQIGSYVVAATPLVALERTTQDREGQNPSTLRPETSMPP